MGGEDDLPKMTAGYVFSLAPESATAIIDSNRDDDYDEDGVLPQAAARRMILIGDDDPYDTSLRTLDAGIAKIVAENKVVANDWVAAEKRNRAIEDYRDHVKPTATGSTDDEFIEPEWCHNPTPVPKVSVDFSVASNGRRVSKADLDEARKLRALTRQIRDAITRNDKPAAGALLLKVKHVVGHGKFVEWVEREFSITARTCQNWMALAIQRPKYRPPHPNTKNSRIFYSSINSAI